MPPSRGRFRPDASGLLAEINLFLPAYREGGLLGNLAMRKYFEDLDEVGQRIRAGGDHRLSPYDAYFRHFSN